MNSPREITHHFKIIFGSSLFVLILLYFLSGIYTIKPNELGVVRRFGKPLPEVFGPGIHYRLPYPIDTLDTLDVTTIRSIAVGSYVAGKKTLKQPSTEELQRLSGDRNIAVLNMILQYKIKTPGEYLFSTINPDQLVSYVASSVILQIVSNMEIDEMLTRGKLFIQNRTKTQTQNVLDKYNTGLEIVSANLQRIKPPSEVVEAFNDVINAKADRNRALNEAHAYRENIIPLARGQAEKILREAEAYKIEKIEHALGDTERFRKILASYKTTRGVTESRLYLETMEKILPFAKIFAVDTQGGKNLLEVKFINP